MNLRFCLSLLTAVTLLCACGQPAAPPGVKIGKPYVIDGKTYYPSYDPSYDKMGSASWYGPGFHGKRTANGEVYNQNDLTAAHPTLPMPSLVRVTNLENGKSLIVRVNDRGPFKRNRIIDLSKKSAQKLGVTSTARVRVQFLKEETESYIASLKDSGRHGDMVAMNDAAEKVKEDSIIASTEPSEQIVESTESTSHAGQTIDAAAPVLSVASSDAPASAKPRQPLLISEAVAAEPTAGGTKPVELIDAGPEKQIFQNDIATPVSQPKPVEKPVAKKYAPPAPAKSAGGYLIQAGAFASETNAEKLRQRISAMNMAVAVDYIDMNGKQWWRVRAGPYADKAEADRALEKCAQAACRKRASCSRKRW
jgi:rare lipoprotein A